MLPYVAPRSSIDPVHPELILFFLQAVAKKTDAFKELRNALLPRYGLKAGEVTKVRPLRIRGGEKSTLKLVAPVDDITNWLAKWNLSSFADYEVNQQIESFVYQILSAWKQDPQAAKGLVIDCVGWMTPSEYGRMAGDRPPITITWRPYNRERESFAAWADQKRAATEKLIQNEREREKQEREKYGLKDYARRSRTSKDQHEAFEWLALSICPNSRTHKGRTDAEIAQDYKLGPGGKERVKKARQALIEQGFRRYTSNPRGTSLCISSSI